MSSVNYANAVIKILAESLLAAGLIRNRVPSVRLNDDFIVKREEGAKNAVEGS